MVTDNYILSQFYSIINVAAVNNAIDGQIYIGKKPVDSKLQDIVINTLGNISGDRDLINYGTANINCFCVSTQASTQNTSKLNEMANAVISALNLVDGVGTTGLFSYEIEWAKTLQDFEDEDMYYINIRLKYYLTT